MTVDTEYKQHQIDTLRSDLDLLQTNIPQLEAFMSKKFIRKHLTLWRDCVTVQKKHYPKAPTLFTEMSRFDINALFAMIITHDPSHMDLIDYIERFKDLLEYPQTYFDNYDDMFPPLDDEGKPMMRELEYRDFLLAERHREHRDVVGGLQGVDEQPNVNMAGKRFKNAYKKYVKEWKANYD